MTLTTFLAQFFGLMFIVLSISMLLNKSNTLAVFEDLIKNRSILWLGGLLALSAGLAMVLTHNLWLDGGAAFLITLVGWVFLLKGLALLILSPASFEKLYRMVHMEQVYYVYAVIFLILGLYLAFAGFA